MLYERDSNRKRDRLGVLRERERERERERWIGRQRVYEREKAYGFGLCSKSMCVRER